MASLSLRGLRKRFGKQEVLKGIDLDVADGEFVIFVGPSGCGKSTLLRCIAGLEEIDEGELLIDGRRLNDTPPAERGLAMVFQSYALYPHMTVAENLGFGLKMAGKPKAEIAAAVQEAARILQIEPLLDRRPAALSGGQRQRVAIGRAIVRRPGVFLFDEPLSNLDAALRTQTRMELSRLHRQLGATMLYVTHDQAEAMTLGDRIVVFNEGRVEQVGQPMDLYRQPANRFVAGFLGSPRINFLPAQALRSGPEGLTVELPGLTLAGLPYVAEPGQALTLGIRPEALTLVEAGGPGLPAEVQLVEQMGDVSYVHVKTADGWLLSLRAPPEAGEARGAQVTIAVPAAACLLFDDAGRALPRRGGVSP